MNPDIGAAPTNFSGHGIVLPDRAALWEYYVAAGSPYGATPIDEDLKRWGTEQGYNLELVFPEGAPAVPSANAEEAAGIGGDSGDTTSVRHA